MRNGNLGCIWLNPSFVARWERTAIQQAGHKGVLVVAAAGNAGEDNDIAYYPDPKHQAWAPSYPASYSLSNILSVAASNDHDQYVGK